MELTKEVLQELAKPFSPTQIKWKIQTKPSAKGWSLVVPHIDARDVSERLDMVVGGDWSDDYSQPQASKGDGLALECRLTVCGVTRVDVGTDADAKAVYSNAFKRAAVKFGVGRHLYRFPTVFAKAEAAGKSHRLTDQAKVDLVLLSDAVTSGKALPKMSALYASGYNIEFTAEEAPETEPEPAPRQVDTETGEITETEPHWSKKVDNVARVEKLVADKYGVSESLLVLGMDGKEWSDFETGQAAVAHFREWAKENVEPAGEGASQDGRAMDLPLVGSGGTDSPNH